MKILRWTAWFLLGLLILVAGIGTYLYFSLQPQYEGSLDIEGLENPVSVSYDQEGIPHIEARSKEDAFCALGYVQAQDRLFQMEMLRRLGSGRLAEILGQDLLEVDRFFHTLGLPAHSKHSARLAQADSSKAYHQLSEAYLQGINQYVQTGPPPIEFLLAGIPMEKFSQEDLYYVVGYMSYSFDQALKTDPVVERLYQELDSSYWNALHLGYAPGQTAIPSAPLAGDTLAQVQEALHRSLSSVQDKMPLPVYRASNSWVLGAQKTKNGRVLFANDTHIGYSQPSVWYEAQLKAPGLELYGNFLAGFPFPLIGHTDRHSWGLTMYLNDDMDLYREKVQGDSVLHADGWRRLGEESQIIPVKDLPDDTLLIRHSAHGPILNEVLGKIPAEAPPMAASWTYLDFPVQAVEAAYRMSFASTMEEFYNGAHMLPAPGLNVMYGDREGNYAWWAVARLRRYAEGVNTHRILEGSTGAHDRRGYAPISDNPHAINPPKGYVYSANNPSKRPSGEVYPGYYYAGLRAQAITSALDTSDQWDVAACKKLVTSHRSGQYPANLRLLTNLLLPAGYSQEEKELLQALQKWDGQHSLEALGPVVYYPLVYQVLKEAMTDELGEELWEDLMETMIPRRSMADFLKQVDSPWWDDKASPEKESRTAIVKRAWEKVYTRLREDWGADHREWRWGDVHQVTHRHAFAENSPALAGWLNVGPFPIEGGEEVINKQAFPLSGKRIYEVSSGPAMRIIHDFAPGVTSESINPTGQSGNPLSPFYRNQARRFVRGEFRPQWTNRDSVKEYSYSQLELR